MLVDSSDIMDLGFLLFINLNFLFVDLILLLIGDLVQGHVGFFDSSQTGLKIHDLMSHLAAVRVRVREGRVDIVSRLFVIGQ